MTVRIENLITAGTFDLDGGTWELENNVWIVGDDDEVIVIDPAHDARAITRAVGGRRVTAILVTHAHNDHIGAARELRDLVDAPVCLNPADLVLWKLTYADTAPDPFVPDAEVHDGDRFDIAGATLEAISTPGHSPGSSCYYLASENTLFSGDTLFHGGPGATGRSFSDFPTIISSIRSRLLTLPENTTVLTGHGESTTIGGEAPQLEEWIARGY